MTEQEVPEETPVDPAYAEPTDEDGNELEEAHDGEAATEDEPAGDEESDEEPAP